MIIIDSFLENNDLEDLKQIVLGSDFPWYMNDGVTHHGDGHIQFTHLMYREDKFTRKFHRDLFCLTKNKNSKITKRLDFFSKKHCQK